VKPLVSIVVSNFNYERFVDQAISSALLQTYPCVEVIVVDDGSTDSSRAVIDRYRQRCKVILKANGGQASALNEGLRHARGAYVLLLDSDDFLMPDAVETFVASFPPGYARTYCELRLVDAEGRSSSSLSRDKYFRAFDGDLFEAAKAGNEFFWAPTSANFFDAEKLRRVLPIPEAEFRICADAYLLVRTALLGKVRAIERELAAYRVHDANNFAVGSLAYSDPRRLKTRIENHYRIKQLLQESSRSAGFVLPDGDDGDYGLLQSLCVARAMRIQTAYSQAEAANSLLSRIGRYSVHSSVPFARRLAQCGFLLLLVGLPTSLTLTLVRWADERRMARKGALA
jgi:glycosyltransferase involved in cell wall biosynthesis